MLSREEIERVLDNVDQTIGEYCKKNNISRMKFYRYCKKYNIDSKKKVKSLPKEHLYTGFKNLSGTKWSGIKGSARHRNIVFDINIEYAHDLIEKQNYKCNLSGLYIQLNKRGLSNASLDRIDSAKGYIEGNVQWLHKDINKMKSTFSQNQFLEYCRIITENNKSD